MNDCLIEAREEMKRLEHTIHVTLKYTRTIDVIRNALTRLISSFDFIIGAFLQDAQEKKLIPSIPKSPSLKSSLLMNTYPEDKELSRFIIFYTFLRDTVNADYEKREEFRRHVTMVVDFQNRTAEIDIDSLETCERVTFQFFDYAKEFLKENLEDD